MGTPPTIPRIFRFGTFEANSRIGQTFLATANAAAQPRVGAVANQFFWTSTVAVGLRN